MVWLGELSPAEYADTYEVIIDHERGLSPVVYVARPRLQLVNNLPLEHVYSWNTLCLYLGGRQWNPGIPIADTLVPWTSEWLFFYELWLSTGGEWLGEGVHPAEGAGSRSGRRHYAASREKKLNRLIRALRIAYGPMADVDELLYNARLKPSRDSQTVGDHVGAPSP